MDLVIFLIQMNPLFLVLSLITVLLSSCYVTSRHRPVYLIDHACFKPGPAQCGAFTEESLGFQRRMLERSGVGQSTYIPVSLMTLPLSQCMKTAREEAETVIFGVVDDLIAKTGVRMEDIGVLVVNCSLFCPTPFLAAMIENRYGLPEDLISYNLSGMSCSAGLISVDLVKHLLQVHPNIAGEALEANITTLGPLILPISKQRWRRCRGGGRRSRRGGGGAGAHGMTGS